MGALGNEDPGGESTTQRSEGSDEASPVRRSLHLRGLLPEDSLRYPLVGARWVLGRDQACDIRLRYAGVSRTHAEIIRRGPLYSVRDLGSTNGVYLEGERVEHGGIAPGALLRLGDWLGTFEEAGNDPLVDFQEIAPDLWGGDVLHRALSPMIRAASAQLPILLVGPTGTGKERVARALHHFGGSGGVFHAINCATLQPALADAELFGYRKGAFTGAERNFSGQLRAAHGGTLFLDEVADLPLPTQAKLLRALDSGEIVPLGEATPTRFSARVVAACQEPLENLVERGRFREDLAARLGGLVVTLPSLRERRADVPRLFELFLRQRSAGTAPAVSARVYERLCLHTWPKNVRELELLAHRLLAVNGLEPAIRPSHLPEGLGEAAVGDDGTPQSSKREEKHLRDVERFKAALADARGNVKSAAKSVGISRQRAYRLIGSRGLGEVVSTARSAAQNGGHERDP
jgi:transcriptional regulator with AAA-type ATPase domain